MKNLLASAIVCIFLISSCEDKKGVMVENAPENTSSDTTTAMAAEPDSATMMQNWMAYAMPSDIHEMMASWNGSWMGEVNMWQEPGGQKETSNIHTENKMLLDGRYQQSVNTGLMMGQPFEGISSLAYDNAKNEFISTWIHNMGTGLMVMHGQWDEPTKTINFSGKMVDPSAGDGREMDFRQR